METSEIVTLTALLVGMIAILLSIFALMWQMHSQGNKLGERLSDVELEQARLEGANGTLSDILKQQSHTHEAGD